MSRVQQQTPASPTHETTTNAQTTDGFSGLALDAKLSPSASLPPNITPQNALYLQRAIGNAALQRMVTRPSGTQSPANPSPTPVRHHTTPTVQAKLDVGPADDKYEREADAISKQVVQRSTTPKHLVNRVQRTTAAPQVGPEGGALDNSLESKIRSSNGGTAMPSGVRRAIEPKLGADLSNVKVHTDSHAANLNQQLGAKAFTHKNHIFYGAGHSPSDVQLTAHEAVHTVQQGATKVKRSPDQLQRVYQHPVNQKFYSHVLSKQEITAGNGVITATATGGPGGGHAILMFEYLEGGVAMNKKVDLTAGMAGSSGIGSGGSGPGPSRGITASGSGSTSGSEAVSSGSTSSQSTSNLGIRINIGDASEGSLNRVVSAQRRSWVVTKGQIDKGMIEAVAVQSDMAKNVGKYTYKLFGRSIFAKNPMNCASFAERVLQKAGINASATSWWFGTKLPSTLAKGENVGYTPDTSFPVAQPVTPTPPTPVVMGGRGAANPADYDHIKQVVFRSVHFVDGKIIAGDVTEFNYKDTPSKMFTFSDDPQTDSQLPTTIFKVTVHKDMGLARLEPPVGQGVVRAAYVLLSDLFSDTGVMLTA